MTRYDLAYAIGEVDDLYLLAAQKTLQEGTGTGARPIRRVLVGLVAAIAAVFLSLTVAMAVSPEVRETVLAFFHIDLTETVTHDEAWREPLGEGVTVSRVLVDSYGQLYNGLVGKCIDPIELRQGSHYQLYSIAALAEGSDRSENYAEEENAVAEVPLIPLEMKGVKTTYEKDGLRYDFDLIWATDGVHSTFGYVSIDYRYFVIEMLEDGMALVRLMENNAYPILLDLNTGEFIDFYADTGLENYRIEKLGYCNGSLLFYAAGSYFYNDPATDTFLELDALCGTALTSCGFLDSGKIVCWTSTEDIENVYTATTAPTISGWLVDPVSREVTQLMENETVLVSNQSYQYEGDSGLIFPIGELSYMNYYLEVVDGTIYAVHTESQTKTLIESITWPEGFHFIHGPSPKGTKLMLLRYQPDSINFAEISVLDMEKARHITITRDVPPADREGFIAWVDDNTISVDSTIYTEDGFDSGDSWFYLYHID